MLASVDPASEAKSKPEQVKVSYIPTGSLGKVLNSIPDGAIINFVRESSEKRPVLITHQGIVVKEGTRVLLRHVSPGGRVRTVLLRDYLRGDSQFVGFTLSGISGKAQG